MKVIANIAKIGAVVVVGGILVLNTKSCIEGQIELDERRKRALEGKNNPTTSSDVMTQPTTLDYSENSFVEKYICRRKHKYVTLEEDKHSNTSNKIDFAGDNNSSENNA